MWITNLLSWGGRLLPFIKNIPYLKYIGVVGGILGLLYGAYQIYEFNKDYEDLKANKEVLENRLKSVDAELARQVALSNYNANMVLKERQKAEDTLEELEDKYKIEIARLERLSKIKEKTYNEEDGVTAPVLRNTIRRLFSEDPRTQD